MVTSDTKNDLPEGEPLSSALSIRQLATRWGVGRQRVSQLVEAGRIPGAFVIPSSGQYGRTVRIPAEAVASIEAEWGLSQSMVFTPRKRKGTSTDRVVPLTHFPELAEKLDSESPSDDPR